MTEKNYTEYERDLRDFEKKPLAKDRETLIFPPESDIKGSDDQNASVLPVAPKLSMRKEAQIMTKEDPNYTPGCPACEEALDMEATYEDAHFSDVPYYWDLIDTARERILLKQCIEKYEREKLNKESSKKIFVNVSMRKEAEALHEKDKVRVTDSNSYYYGQEGRVTGSHFSQSGDSEVRFTVEFEDGSQGKFGEKQLQKTFANKNETKKISVNDKILTSTKKTARIVAISDDIVFWVSVDGEKDFGSDFVDEIELVEEHEPHEPFEKHRRERGEPIDSGLTKEVPLEENIPLASKNRRKKKAGTWSFPLTAAAATTLESIVIGLQNRNISVSQAQESLYSVYGDDKLFDDLQELINSISSRAAEVIIGHVRQLLDDYESNPENFEGEELDPETKEILERI